MTDNEKLHCEVDNIKTEYDKKNLNWNGNILIKSIS